MKELIVVKLGGGAAAAPQLRRWLSAIAQGAGRVVLVPGGGPFADAVRTAQTAMGFDDKTAHALALAAMRQYGMAICALHPALTQAETPRAIAATMHAGRVPVWLPETMALADPTIAASWDVTSDSLALWLAAELGARMAIFIKQARPAPMRAGALTDAGIMDRAFPAFLASAGLPAYVAGPGDVETLGGVLGSGQPAGLSPVLLDESPPGMLQ